MIHGREDKICSFEKAMRFYESFPDKRELSYKWVEGGHSLNEMEYVIDQINYHRSDVE